jgi:hypothetical protein
MMNTAHNGQRLGQALFKICQRLDIVHKVCVGVPCTFDIRYTLLYGIPYYALQIGHITCDNASNNGTMIQEFSRCYKKKTGEHFDVKKRHIR